MKRHPVIGWDDYFVLIAEVSAMRSKDPRTQVGACVVDGRKRILGVGYNGFPIGCSDDELPWCVEGVFGETKYAYVCHAELNAIANTADRSGLMGSTLYTTLFPCNECAKLVIQVGICRVVYSSDKYSDTPECRAAQRMFSLAGVAVQRIRPIWSVELRRVQTEDE